MDDEEMDDEEMDDEEMDDEEMDDEEMDDEEMDGDLPGGVQQAVTEMTSVRDKDVQNLRKLLEMFGSESPPPQVSSFNLTH
jgi:hypothetical protein